MYLIGDNYLGLNPPTEVPNAKLFGAVSDVGVAATLGVSPIPLEFKTLLSLL